MDKRLTIVIEFLQSLFDLLNIEFKRLYVGIAVVLDCSVIQYQLFSFVDVFFPNPTFQSMFSTIEGRLCASKSLDFDSG